MMRGDYGEECLGGDHAVEPLRLLLLRFLRGNAFSASKAWAQVRVYRVSVYRVSVLEEGIGRP